MNLDAGYGKYDDRLLSQSSPNTGAVTYYADYNMTASRDIVAGEELSITPTVDIPQDVFPDCHLPAFEERCQEGALEAAICTNTWTELYV